MLNIVILTALIGGTISGFVKLGWEILLPPRSPQRNETNPPQKLLQQIGISEQVTQATINYLGNKIPYVSLIIHFGFSIVWAGIYALLSLNFPEVAWGQGTIFGIFVWILFHIIIMPAMKTIPSMMQQPWQEHISEFLGHIVWAFTINIVYVYLTVL
ncbi:DUF1440 domain-containing protein [Periweissella beninensis]|uniref:DUF1440 domain-containing protein n=1 Tax=Periweissella beninensis TaxID=504936 RepID=UPI0021A5DD06|nr:DUF1440 domain-containing protein [Periweissella beninensis]MCT4396195.1 DUF1440 domain-containing protein [Periweissella beninensis]